MLSGRGLCATRGTQVRETCTRSDQLLHVLRRYEQQGEETRRRRTEAIRQSGNTSRTLAKTGLTCDEFRLYELYSCMRTVV